MIDARQNDKRLLTQRIRAEYLAGLSNTEFLCEIAEFFHEGAPMGLVIKARLLSIAATCKAIEEASE